MYAFNDSPYRGAYLTDIIKEEIEPSSGKLMTRMRNGYDVQKHIDSFGAEMDRVGVDKNALFILFGNDVYELFAKHLASTYSNHVKCRHYSHYRTNDAEWVEEAWSKLEAHYVKTRGTLKTLKFVRNRRMKAQLEKLREKLDRL